MIYINYLEELLCLSFIIFEIVAQAYLVFTFYKIKEKIKDFINIKFLIAKFALVTLLINNSINYLYQ